MNPSTFALAALLALPLLGLVEALLPHALGALVRVIRR